MPLHFFMNGLVVMVCLAQVSAFTRKSKETMVTGASTDIPLPVWKWLVLVLASSGNCCWCWLKSMQGHHGIIQEFVHHIVLPLHTPNEGVPPGMFKPDIRLATFYATVLYIPLQQFGYRHNGGYSGLYLHISMVGAWLRA